MVQADQLVLLSDIDGLYTADPQRDPARRISRWSDAITPEIEAMGGEPPPGYSSGGMRTKLVAARIATSAGCAMAIAPGDTAASAARAGGQGARCTWFLAAPEGRSARKRWILGTLQPLGAFTVDAGAARALAGGTLAAARRRAHARGPVRARRCGGGARAGRDAARRAGSPPTRSADAARIIGHRSEEIEAILGWRGRDELIHRDDLALL